MQSTEGSLVDKRPLNNYCEGAKMENVILSAKNILKVYPNGIVANKDVNFEVKQGEIHALIGENGAGKSTLMKILFGIEHPEEGQIVLNGQEVQINSPKEAIELGIGMVHQHFMLVDSLSIAENIALGYEPKKKGLFLDKVKMVETAKECAEKYNFNIDVTQAIRDVSVGVKQKTEILKALIRGAKVLILDEPTAVLTPQETEELFIELDGLRNSGHTIIFISHKLNEIMKICDRVTIMRHGTTVGTMNICDTSPEDISRKMVGRDVVLHIEKQPAKKGEPILKAEKLTYLNDIGKKMLNNVSFSVHSGEILGVAGVEGNGQAELAKIFSGLTPPADGKIIIKDMLVDKCSPMVMRKEKISYIPEDRMVYGVAQEESIKNNLFVDKIDLYTKNKIFLDKKKMETNASQRVKDFTILTESIETPVSMLSGGNIQKVVAAREITQETEIVIAEQPTRGIDAGASELIRRKIIDKRDNGAAILLISADLNEILEMSDSLIVMHNGEISAYFQDVTELTEEELGYYMLGVKKQSTGQLEETL